MSNLNRTLSLDPRLFQEIRRKGAVPITDKLMGLVLQPSAKNVQEIINNVVDVDALLPA